MNSPGRLVTAFVLGTLMAAVLAVACSAIDPIPPDPHTNPDPQGVHASPDASDAEASK